MAFRKRPQKETTALGPHYSRWFAWYPVVLEEGRVAFCQTLYRRKVDEWEYRTLDDEWVKTVNSTPLIDIETRIEERVQALIRPKD